MTYDGDFMDVDELAIDGEFHFVIVDLLGEKSTPRILSALQEGFPTPATDIHRGVHKLLGEINKQITGKAVSYLAQGKVKELGELMNEAQAEFDKYAQPACPDQLTMPLLHKMYSLYRMSALYSHPSLG